MAGRKIAPQPGIVIKCRVSPWHAHPQAHDALIVPPQRTGARCGTDFINQDTTKRPAVIVINGNGGGLTVDYKITGGIGKGNGEGLGRLHCGVTENRNSKCSERFPDIESDHSGYRHKVHPGGGGARSGLGVYAHHAQGRLVERNDHRNLTGVVIGFKDGCIPDASLDDEVIIDDGTAGGGIAYRRAGNRTERKKQGLVILFSGIPADSHAD